MENERANFFAVTHNTANSAAMRASAGAIKRAQSLKKFGSLELQKHPRRTVTCRV